MKVLIISAKLFNGGAEHVARKNIEVMLENGHEVSCFTIYDKEIDEYIKNEENKAYVRYVPTSDNKLSYIWSSKNAKFLKKLILEFRPNIIHIHSYIPFSPSIGKVIRDYKHIIKYKVVLTHHTFSMVCSNDSLFNYRKNEVCELCLNNKKDLIIRNKCTNKSVFYDVGKYIKSKLWRLFFQNSLIDVNISPSKFLKNKLVHSGKFSENEISVVSNPCIDRNMLVNNSPDINDLLDQGVNSKTNQIVYFGRISVEKNVKVLLDAFELLNTDKNMDIKLIIIGNGPLLENIKEEIKQRNLTAKIKMMGYMNPKELKEFIENKKYFILPSKWYENSPVSIIEAYDNKMIPLVSDRGGMKELVKKVGIGYTFDPMDPIDIARKIKSAVKNYDEDFSDLNKRHLSIINDYTLDEYYFQIIDVYKRLVGDS